MSCSGQQTISEQSVNPHVVQLYSPTLILYFSLRNLGHCDGGRQIPALPLIASTQEPPNTSTCRNDESSNVRCAKKTS